MSDQLPCGSTAREGAAMTEQQDTGQRRMPAVRTSDERAVLDTMLDWYRAGVVHKVAGMSDEHAAAAPLASPTSAAGVVKHLALVEDHWFTAGIGQQSMPEPWASVDFDSDPDWEFRTARDEPLADAVREYEQACARSRAATASLPLDHTVSGRHGEYSLRWVLVHMLEETARHLGHLDILREMADGSTGE